MLEVVHRCVMFLSFIQYYFLPTETTENRETVEIRNLLFLKKPKG